MPTKRPFEPIPSNVKNTFLSWLVPFVNWSSKVRIHPNHFTTIGFLLGGGSGYFAAIGQFRLSSLFIILSGFCDVLDGKLARQSGKVTKFGALYDSTLDRYSEVIVFFGFAYYFMHHPSAGLPEVAIAFALGGSLMVSYVRARAEGLGFQCKVGIMQRTERILLLALGGLIHKSALITVFWLIAILSNITAIQRIVHVWKADRASHSPGKSEGDPTP